MAKFQKQYYHLIPLARYNNLVPLRAAPWLVRSGQSFNYCQCAAQLFLMDVYDLYLHCRLVVRANSSGSGLVVMGGGSGSEGCGFESWRRIMDGHYIFSH